MTTQNPLDFTAQEHAAQMISIAIGALGLIRAMQLTVAERDFLRRADKLLGELRNSVTEPESATLKLPVGWKD